MGSIERQEVAPAVPQVFKVCTNCTRHVPSANHELHESVCCRRFHRCAACDLMMHVSERDEHRAAFGLGDAELAEALRAGRAAAITKAIEHGTALDVPTRVQAAGSRDVALVMRILRDDDGAVRLTHPATGLTMLHHAAASGSTRVVQLLLERDSDPNAISALGKTPLEVARGDEVKLLLLARGATLRSRFSHAMARESPHSQPAAGGVGPGPGPAASGRQALPLPLDFHEFQLQPRLPVQRDALAALQPRRLPSKRSMVQAMRHSVRRAQEHDLHAR
jgi:hypothetical protein